jgi:hypothetical protein
MAQKIVKIKELCPDCSKEIEVNIAQTVINQSLRWYTSFVCPFCGATEELDGMGFPPEEVREVILSEEGEWNLSVNSPKEIARTLKTIRQALGLSISDAAKLLKSKPESLISGTNAEMSWLSNLLQVDGVQAEIIRVNTRHESDVDEVDRQNSDEIH